MKKKTTFRIVNKFTNEIMREFDNFREFKHDCLLCMKMGADSIYGVETWVNGQMIDSQEMDVYFD